MFCCLNAVHEWVSISVRLINPRNGVRAQGLDIAIASGGGVDDGFILEGSGSLR
ncbi:hypothetical protein J0895_04020 [Phormidium pseudopriestleyi FRX01]|uniref:Uncharacterized protein n=1 Tax=Phormidium pseudopriestleyi FRX01 TaxID=1759528 RepID=A0ABS3FPJ8_9CYAN|nr:hypothetical protein [Phormidium pseudopriestleyi FRX01]